MTQVNPNLARAREDLTMLFQKIAGDFIPLIVENILKTPKEDPPPVRLQNVVLAYPLPEIGGAPMSFAPPPGDGWSLTSLDTNSGDRILGHWHRRIVDAIDAEFADDDLDGGHRDTDKPPGEPLPPVNPNVVTS